MRNKINTPAILLAMLFLIASNGVAVFEHICNSSNARHYTFFSKMTCKMEAPVAPCCAKKNQDLKKKKCCEHKQFYSKLQVDGFTAKPLVLKPNISPIFQLYGNVNTYTINPVLTEQYYSGLAPPVNHFLIQFNLQPTQQELQIYLC